MEIPIIYSWLQESGMFWAFFGASIAAVLSAIGSSLGTGIAGQAATGLTAEKPELGMKAIILQALPGSQAIYGFVGLFFVVYITLVDGIELTATQGLMIFAACLPVGVAGLFSGLLQGRVLAGAMNMVAKDESNFVKAMIMGAIIETFAIFGLLETILMLLKV